MKRIMAIALITLSSFATLGSAFAQDRGVQATIPFNFTVGDQSLPSGIYTVTAPAPGMLSVRNNHSHAEAFTTTYRNWNDTASQGKLVFDRYGDRYFLRQITGPYPAINLKLPLSKAEKQVKTQEARSSVPEQILVAAR